MSLETQALSTLFEMSRDAVLGIENNTICFANPAAFSLLGAVPGEEASDRIPDYILSDPSDRFIASVRLGTQSGHATVTRSGEFTLLCFAMAPEEAHPSPILERAMHDFSNALMSSRLAMDVLIKKTGAEDDTTLQGYAASLYREYFRMKRLCEHIATAGALQQQSIRFYPAFIHLDQLCRDLHSTVSYFAPSLGISMELLIEEADYSTMADPGLLESMLLNLLANSIAHTKPGAKVRLSLSRRKDRLILAVDDRGSGITTDALSSLMDGSTQPDTTDPFTGAGLGLTIARGLAELHGGALILESRPGEGTKLRISLPVTDLQSDVLHTPGTPYRNDGMDRVLTEFSVILDKKFYNKTMFD